MAIRAGLRQSKHCCARRPIKTRSLTPADGTHLPASAPAAAPITSQTRDILQNKTNLRYRHSFRELIS
jgi:hypothetical protein